MPKATTADKIWLFDVVEGNPSEITRANTKNLICTMMETKLSLHFNWAGIWGMGLTTAQHVQLNQQVYFTYPHSAHYLMYLCINLLQTVQKFIKENTGQCMF